MLSQIPRTPAHDGKCLHGPHPLSRNLPSSLIRGCRTSRLARVDDLVNSMELYGISKSQVSRLCEETDGKMKGILARPLEGDWP